MFYSVIYIEKFGIDNQSVIAIFVYIQQKPQELLLKSSLL